MNCKEIDPVNNITNNREYHRNWFKCLIKEQEKYDVNQTRERKIVESKKNVNTRQCNPLRQGHGFGFEYGVQDDGMTLLNHYWKRKIKYASIFPFKSKRFNDDHCEYQASPNVVSKSHRDESVIQREATITPKQSVLLSPLGSWNVSSSVPVTVPSSNRRKRNRHNAIYGDFLPNILNSPGCAKKVFGKNVMEKEQRDICARILFENKDDDGIQSPSVNRLDNDKNSKQMNGNDLSVDNDLDEMDLLFAQLDLDQMVSTYYEGKKKLHETSREYMHDRLYEKESITHNAPVQKCDEIVDTKDCIKLTFKSTDANSSSKCSSSTEIDTSKESFSSRQS